MEKLILLCNDDGIEAPGLQYLISFVKDFGKLVVVAPETGQSGMGHAVTISSPLRLRAHSPIDDIERYSVNGTPVDCVKMALDKVLDRKPDLIIGGINHGANTSVNILYSGTMAIALEGAMLNIPSIGFSSLCYDHNYDMAHYGKWVKTIVEITLKNGMPDSTCLNVNMPHSNEIKGIKICRQSMGYWDESFDARIDTHKKPYYWLRGDFNLYEKPEDSDEFALEDNYVSIVPVKIDLTNYEFLADLTKQYQ
ncbi:MAG: 5'/3'-nucleotidase SurE [Marinilabiliales bacterium]|nr:MAG: 5'/3'-nucleotidase SurE [Marinilabiliales bacterium]